MTVFVSANKLFINPGSGKKYPEILEKKRLFVNENGQKLPFVNKIDRS